MTPKNVRLLINGVETTFTDVHKIRTTNRSEGGSIDWVPEEDYAEYISKGEATITSNGTYTADDFNCDSLQRITVKLGDAEGFEYPDNGMDPDTSFEYEKIENPVDPETGDLEYPDPTYADLTPSDSFEQIPTETIDPEEVSTKIPDAPTDTITTNIYKGPGTITGVDPNTGEPTTISTDENGNIVKTQIPDHIEVIIPSGVSTVYSAGDTINYNQYQYAAYKADGTAFPITPDAPLPNLIPFSEMYFPVEVVPDITADDDTSSSGSTHSSGSFDDDDTSSSGSSHESGSF